MKENRLERYLVVVYERRNRKLLGYYLAEEVHKYNYLDDGRLRNASIEINLKYIKPSGRMIESIQPYHGGFVSLDNCRMEVSISSTDLSKGSIFVDPGELRGYHVGTYFLNKVIRWVKQWPEATVRPIYLSSVNSNAENLARRDKFYRNFGLTLFYHDETKICGQSTDMKAAQLTCYEKNIDNIAKYSIESAMCHLIGGQWNLELQNKGLREQLAKSDRLLERKQSQPFKFITILVIFLVLINVVKLLLF